MFDNGTCKVSARGTINKCRRKLFTPCCDVRKQPTPSGLADDSGNDKPVHCCDNFYTSDADSSNDEATSRSPKPAKERVGRK